MKVFELHFNPKAKKDVIFDTFYYVPENIYEKRLGHLFLAGKLINALPQNSRFLKNLARTIKDKFYSTKNKRPESCLKKSLTEANLFLEKIAKKGDVGWISNLNFAILNLIPIILSVGGQKKETKYKLNFTKTGNVEIFLTREGKVSNIGTNLEAVEVEPYPLKIFFNLASGKLEQGDRILIMTKEIFETFSSQNIMDQIADLPFLDEEKLNQIFSDIQNDISGVCLLISLEAPAKKTLGQEKIIFKQKILTRIPVKGILAKIRKVSTRIKRKIPLLERRPAFLDKFTGMFSRPFKAIVEKIADIKPLFKKKNAILILSFLFLLLFGGFWARIEEQKKISQIQTELAAIQEKIDEADTLLVLDQQEKAIVLLLQAFEEIQLVSRGAESFVSEIAQKKEILTAKLSSLSQLEKIESPELIFEFPAQVNHGAAKFVPQRLINLDEKLYFFSNFSNGILELKSDNAIDFFETGINLDRAVHIDDGILFFSGPNLFLPFKQNNLEQRLSLESFSENFESATFSSFKSSLYFLDSQTCAISKYLYLGGLQWSSPRVWSEDKVFDKTCSGAKSMIVDGGIWLLGQNNLIERYYGGRLEKTIEVKIFPSCKNLTKIWTSAIRPELYVLEPEQKRIIILDKQGRIIKQYQSEKFDNLKDFAISEDGKTIYLLNGLKLYQINFNF